MGADMAEEKASGTEFSEKAVEELKKISPLALPEYIAECEFYDETETRKVLDDVVKEFEKDGGTVDAVLKPVMYSVADGLLEAIPGGAAMRRKGLTPQRIVSECEAFTYSNEDAGIGAIPGVAYVDFKNARDYRAKFGESIARRYDANMRKQIYADTGAMSRYKAAAGGATVMRDEYTGQRIYLTREEAVRNGEPGQVANTDHIVSLSSIQKDFAGNYALSRKDIREIANQDYNFAMTSAAINIPKSDRSMREYLAYLDKHPDKVPAGFNVEKMRSKMLQMERDSRSAIDSAANKKVLGNIKSTLKRADRKGKVIRGRLMDKSVQQAKDYAVGNVILYLLKPLYWELKDSFKNGFRNGVNADSGMAAIRIRFGRIKSYLVAHAKEFLGDSVWEFIKGFVSSLIEGIIGLFVGMFRSVLKVIKEGIRIFIQAAKILWGRNASKMTPAEKGDAIIKLIGASVASLAGIGIDALLSSIGTPKLLRVPLATMLSGIASAVFMYLLDKADLFGVKSDKRYARVKEIFEARIADMKADTVKFEVAVSERVRANWIEYARLNQRVKDAFDRRDIKAVDDVLQQMAAYFRVTLPYEDTQSFVNFVKRNASIRIDDSTVNVA